MYHVSRTLSLLLVLICVFGVCGVYDVYARKNVEVQVDPISGVRTVNVYRLPRPGQANPVLTVGGKTLSLNPGDKVIFWNGCNFTQTAKNTPTLDLYPEEIDIEFVEVNLKNCKVPDRAVVYGGMVAQYEKTIVKEYSLQLSDGTKTIQVEQEIPIEVPDLEACRIAYKPVNGHLTTVKCYKEKATGNPSDGWKKLNLKDAKDWQKFKTLQGVKAGPVPIEDVGTILDKNRANVIPTKKVITLDRRAPVLPAGKAEIKAEMEELVRLWQVLDEKLSKPDITDEERQAIEAIKADWLEKDEMLRFYKSLSETGSEAMFR